MWRARREQHPVARAELDRHTGDLQHGATLEHEHPFVDVGFSKLVLVPVQEAPGDGTGAWRGEVEALATSLLDLQGTR